MMASSSGAVRMRSAAVESWRGSAPSMSGAESMHLVRVRVRVRVRVKVRN